MGFHFPMMPRLYMALAEADSTPLVGIMHDTPAIPANCQWCTFLRNHDELTLEMVTAEERHPDVGHVRPGAAHAPEPGHPPPPGSAAG